MSVEEKQQAVETSPSGTAARYVQEIANSLVTAGKYALIGAIILVFIWLLGRVMEAMHGNTVFDPVLTCWISVSIITLLAVWIIGSGIASKRNMIRGERNWRAIASWIFFLIIILSTLFYFDGFRTSTHAYPT